jgi:hypothetical protein
VATRRTARKATGTKRAAAKTARILEVSFDGYEPPRGEYMGEDPRPGVYRFELQNVGAHMNRAGDNESIQWIFSCVDEPYAGWGGFMWTDIDPESEYFFRTQHNIRAVLGDVPKGTVKLDLDNPEKFIKAAKVVLGRVVNEENRETGEVRPRLSRVAPDDPNLVTGGGEVDDEEDDEYDELDDEVDDGDEDADVDDEGDEDDTDEEDDEDDEEDDDEEGDEEDEEDEEPEPEPAPKRSRRAAKSAPAAKKASTRRARK